MIDKIECDIPKIANDYHYYLIEMWKALQDGWLPPEYVSEGEYNEARKKDINPALKGFIGFCCSYSGKWFGGYARGDSKSGIPRNYCSESRRNILKQLNKIKGVQFNNGSYIDLLIPDNSVIYCDPPYRGTTKYKDGGFDHDIFWEWADIMIEMGNSVFVSEYNAPDHWVCIWEKEVVSSLTQDTGSKIAIEKLFTRKLING